MYNNGKVTEYSLTPYAVDELAVTVSGDTVTSPYYVNYPSVKGTIKCRVLYNDSIYGLQLISVNPVTTVTLGKNDPNENVTGEIGSVERAQNSYNRAITTLNEKAEEYITTSDGSILVTDARCVGSNPLNKNYPDNLTGAERTAEMYIGKEDYMGNNNGIFFKEDKNYEIDITRLDKIGGIDLKDSTINNSYWLASRMPVGGSSKTLFRINCVIPEATRLLGTYFFTTPLFQVNSDSNSTSTDAGLERGFRPIFILSSTVKIIDGEGTEEVPFEIGL